MVEYIESLYKDLGKFGVEPKKNFKSRVWIINEIINQVWNLKIKERMK